MMRLTILAAALLAAIPAFADPVEGLWRTAADDNGNTGEIAIGTCGEKICGKLVRAYGPDGREIASPNVGRMIVWDMEPAGGGLYDKGKVWSPDRDKTYASKMQLSGDTLSVKGCVLFVCRDGGRWKRVK